MGSLKVLGRAEPEDKLRLVTGLRGMCTDDLSPERKVAVVGEGINDIEAFATQRFFRRRRRDLARPEQSLHGAQVI
jgi:soluble P-type ATPase